MSPYKRSFLELAFDANALKFGEFKLKSGRLSPYFFNASAFSSGLQLQILGRCYRDAIAEYGVEFDGLFGPAYKGIPLASSVAVAFADQGMDYPVSFNRKEMKDHGEGGSLIGASPKGKILIVDDVLSSGLAIRESIEILKPFDTEIVGVLVALNRQERGQESDQMAAEELRESGIPIFEIVSLDDMIGSKNVISNKDLELMNEYRKNYRGADV